MKTFMKTKKVIGVILTVAILAGIVSTTGMAQTNKRSANIKSKGIIDFENGTAVIDATDFTYLADEIDLLEDTYKTETVNALNQVGTYYKLDGSTTFNKGESTLSSADANILPFNAIINGIINSQSIPTERTYSGTLPGETTETVGNISAATAANLSLGTAAWVDGELIVGTGADNNSYYNLGYANGIDYASTGTIEYNYHTHVDGNGKVQSEDHKSTEAGGCFTIPYYYYTYQYKHVDDAGNVYYTTEYIWTTTEYTYNFVLLDTKYILGCGKTTDTIDSATITFN